MIFNTIQYPIAVFHPGRLAESIGFITNNAENDGGMRRAMITE
jgi:hypothetical protein